MAPAAHRLGPARAGEPQGCCRAVLRRGCAQAWPLRVRDTSPVPGQSVRMSIDATTASLNDTDQSRRQPAGKPSPEEVKARRLDALIKAIDWSHVVGWQVARLHEAEQAALRSDFARRGRGEYRQEHRRPFSRLRAETYFLLGAVRQQLRAMERFGDKKKVPSFMHGSKVLIAVRNAAEHWDGRAPEELTGHTPASWDGYTFGGDGTVIAGVLRVDELEAWAREVQARLLQVERDWR